MNNFTLQQYFCAGYYHQPRLKMNQLRLQGYIHDVSAAKNSRVKSFPYFVFALQVDPSLKRRAVCYDISKHKVLKTFQQSREPVVFHNVTQKPSVRDPSEDDIIVNKRSRVNPANNNDIQFEYAEPEADPSHQFTTVQDIIRSIDNNQFGWGIFIDLKVGFNTVNHALLLTKLNQHRIRGVVYDWFKSYLSQREQFVLKLPELL